MDPILITRTFNYILSGVAILGWVYFYIKTKNIVAIAPLSWIINLFAFYTYRYFTLSFSSAIKNTDFLNLWSSLLHTHALILLCLSAFLICAELKNREQYKKTIGKIEEEKLK